MSAPLKIPVKGCFPLLLKATLAVNPTVWINLGLKVKGIIPQGISSAVLSKALSLSININMLCYFNY